MYKLLIFKRIIENILLLPFVMIGRIYARLYPLKKQYRVFYFFPFYHTGGAEKIHQQIARATGGKDCLIYFTRKSGDNTFLNDFIRSGCDIIDISMLTDNKWLYFLNFIYRGIISGHINRQHHVHAVFNGQCNFGYKLSPWIKKKVSQVELIHALNTFSSIRIPYLSRYKISVTVSPQIIQKHKEKYKKIQIPNHIIKRFIAIIPKIELPPLPAQKGNFSFPLRVLYVGRASWEKRPELFAQVAKRVRAKGLQISFELAGDVKTNLPPDTDNYCLLHGDITDANHLWSLYNSANILIIPSLTESGPLVLMEAMAAGCAILSTPVGIVPDHVQNGISGFITHHINDSEKVITEMEEYLNKVYNNRPLLQKISAHNIQYAYANFGIDQFYADYKKLFASLNDQENETA